MSMEGAVKEKEEERVMRKERETTVFIGKDKRETPFYVGLSIPNPTKRARHIYKAEQHLQIANTNLNQNPCLCLFPLCKSVCTQESLD